MSPGFGLIVLIGFAALFYKAAEFEGLSMPVVWAGGSVALYLGAAYWLGWGFWGTLAAQLVLVAWMGAWIHLQKPDVAPLARKSGGRCAGCGRALPSDPDARQCSVCGESI